MRKHMIMAAVCSFALVSCAGESSTSVRTMQRKDKQLTCREVLLEMNEAEFYKKDAVNKRNPSLKSVIMPLGYVSTYMNAEDSIESADARMAYLDKIYEIMQCENQEDYSANQRQPYPPAPRQPQAPRANAAQNPMPAPYGVAPVQPGAYSAAPYGATPASAPVPYGYDPAYMESYTPIRDRFEQRVAEKGLY